MKEKLSCLQTTQQRNDFLSSLNDLEIEILEKDWSLWARKEQLPPQGNWHSWLFLGGRGAGKTRAGAEWLRAIANADKQVLGDCGGRIALIGENFQDVRSVMIEGESGLLEVHQKDERPEWIASRRLLRWPNGVIGQVFSANDPDGLRGNQFGISWADAKTIWGSLIAVSAALLTTLGISLDASAQIELTDAIVQLAGATGALLAIYGRLSATDIIS